MAVQHPGELRWRRAIEAGDLDVWDLRVELETVHHAPPWKRRLGFPDSEQADSTHFWRCRVHPDDLDRMLAAMRAHANGTSPTYEATFRLRSNGSGYRLLHSRGRAIERNAGGRVVRMVGTMIDLTERPWTPRAGLAEGPRGAMAGLPVALPFHLLLDADWCDGLATATASRIAAERDRVLGEVADLLDDSLAELDRRPAP